MLAALVVAPSAGAQARRKAKAWEDFLPPRLGDAERVPKGKLSIGVWEGNYRLPDGKDAEPPRTSSRLRQRPDWN